MSEYRMREIGSEDFDLLLPLMQDCFGMDVNVEYFRWKYLANPAGSFLGFIAISEENEVAAYYGAIPEEYWVDGAKRRIFQSCDTMTHSRHRRRGLFQRLATHLYERLRAGGELFIIGFPGPESAPGLLKFGWKHVFDQPYWIYPKAFSSLRLRSAEAEYTFEPASSARDIPALVARSNAHGVVRSVKTVDVFDWRIGNPLRAYQLNVLHDRKREPVGYACHYVQRNTLFLFDFHAVDRAAERALFGFLKRALARSSGVAMVTFGCAEHAFARTLKRNGFFTNPLRRGPLHEPRPFTFYATEPELAAFRYPDSWCITPFDHDAA